MLKVNFIGVRRGGQNRYVVNKFKKRKEKKTSIKLSLCQSVATLKCFQSINHLKDVYAGRKTEAGWLQVLK